MSTENCEHCGKVIYGGGWFSFTESKIVYYHDKCFEEIHKKEIEETGDKQDVKQCQ